MVLLLGLVVVGCGASVPAATPTPSLEATAGDVHLLLPGDARVFGVGDRVKVGNELYVFLGRAEMDVTPLDGDPAAGDMYAAFLVAFEGIDPGGSRYGHLSLEDDRGVQYRATAPAREPALEFSDGSTGESLELAPGEKTHGWVTFEVPKGAAWLDLVYRPDVRYDVRFRVTP